MTQIMQNARYTVFKRSATSFKSFSTARKMTIERNLSLREARRLCDAFNAARSPSQIRAGTKAEFTAQ